MDIQEIIDLLEKAQDFAKDKNIKRLDSIDAGQTYKWIMQDMFHAIDQALTLLKQQPKATSIGNKIREIASKDILGQTKLVRDKDILNQAADRLDAWWKYINELKEEVDLLKQQPTEYPNSEFTKVQRAAAQCAIDAYEQDEEWCPTKMSRLLEACDRLDRAEAINKELLETCIKAFEESHNPKVEKVLEAAIAKAKK